MYIINFIRGFIMALADSVPGVSGGTIAFILGFYNDFIGALNNLTSKSNLKSKKKSINFLGKLGIGWVVGFVLSILFITAIFDAQIYRISSLFTGFIVCSIPIILKEEKESLKGKYHLLIFTLIGIAVVGMITYFNPSNAMTVSTTSGAGMTLSKFTIPLAIYVFFAGLIAISAMVLPGISGSTILLILGLYAPIITAVKGIITFNFDYLPMVFIFGMGVILGIVTTIKLIKYLLANYRASMIYLILGLMIGSIYAVFMGPTTLEVPKAAMTFNTFSFVFFIIGGVIIIGLQKMKTQFESKQ